MSLLLFINPVKLYLSYICVMIYDIIQLHDSCNCARLKLKVPVVCKQLCSPDLWCYSSTAAKLQLTRALTFLTGKSLDSLDLTGYSLDDMQITVPTVPNFNINWDRSKVFKGSLHKVNLVFHVFSMPALNSFIFSVNFRFFSFESRMHVPVKPGWEQKMLPWKLSHVLHVVPEVKK